GYRAEQQADIALGSEMLRRLGEPDAEVLPAGESRPLLAAGNRYRTPAACDVGPCGFERRHGPRHLLGAGKFLIARRQWRRGFSQIGDLAHDFVAVIAAELDTECLGTLACVKLARLLLWPLLLPATPPRLAGLGANPVVVLGSPNTIFD